MNPETQGLRGALSSIFSAVGNVAGAVSIVAASAQKLGQAGYNSADALEKTTRIDGAVNVARKYKESEPDLSELGITLEDLGLKDKDEDS